jgi:hypothetical protein
VEEESEGDSSQTESDSESSRSSDDEAALEETSKARRSEKYQKKARIEEGRVGHDEHAIYLVTTEEGGKQRKQRDSYFHRAVRNGKLRPPLDSRLANCRAAIDALHLVARDGADGDAEGKSHRSTVYEQACVEAAILTIFSDTEEAEMIRRWRDSDDDESIACNFVPLSPTIVLSIAKLYTGKATDVIAGVKCYAAGLSTLNNMLRAIDHVGLTVGCIDRPTRDPLVRRLKRKVEKDGDPEGAASFDFRDELGPMFDEAIAMQGWNLTKKVMSCAQLITSCATMGRCSDVSKFSPRYEDMRFPKKRDKRHWGPDGLPNHITLGIWQAKGKRKKHKKRRLRLHRNRLNWKLCPVYWLMLWIRISKIKKGPLFVKAGLGTGRAAVFHHYKEEGGYVAAYDKSGRRITFSTDQWRKTMYKIWRKLEMEDLVIHSIRKSAIKWGASCHGAEWELRNNSGHSESSTSWIGYIEDGVLEGEEACQGPNGTTIQDPIYNTWCWKSVTSSKKRRRR